MKRNPMGAKRVSALLVAALLLLPQVAAYALPLPVPKPISSAEELLAWHGSDGEQGESAPAPLAAEPKTAPTGAAEPLPVAIAETADAGAPETPPAASSAAQSDAKSESPVSAGVFYVIAGSALVIAGVSIGIYRKYKRKRTENEEPREKNP